jgi:hypothetical protein
MPGRTVTVCVAVLAMVSAKAVTVLEHPIGQFCALQAGFTVHQ